MEETLAKLKLSNSVRYYVLQTGNYVPAKRNRKSMESFQKGLFETKVLPYCDSQRYRKLSIENFYKYILSVI